MRSTPGFHYCDGKLTCDGVPAVEIAERFGTPCYVYSAGLLRERYGRIRDAFAARDALVCFSVKSLGNLSVLRLLAQCGSGFDVVSGGELFRVIEAGGEPGRTVYAGVGKTAAEIEFALGAGVRMFNVESPAELRCINDVARRIGRQATVAVRVNPDVDAKTHEKTTTGKKENKFGIGLSGTRELAAEAARMTGVALRGLHVHLGSPIYSADPYRHALEKLTTLVGELRSQGCRIDTINIGGGYCISYTGEPVIEPADYAAALKDSLEKLDCSLIIEPGRYISGPSGMLLVRVVYRKESEHGKRFVICDGAMNDLVRPTLYGSFHRIWPAVSDHGMPPVVKPEDRHYGGIQTQVVDVVGPVCESGDFFAKDRPLPAMEAGDVLAVFDAGAYGSTMSSNYNARPRGAEVMADAGEATLARRRESYEDLVAAEKDLQESTQRRKRAQKMTSGRPKAGR